MQVLCRTLASSVCALQSLSSSAEVSLIGSLRVSACLIAVARVGFTSTSYVQHVPSLFTVCCYFPEGDYH